MTARTTSNVLNDQLQEVLQTLDQEELTVEESLKSLEKEIKEFEAPSFDYKKNSNFDDIEDFKEDVSIAREMIMDTLDKSRKISDLIMAALVTDTTNVMYLQLAQESTRTVQQAVKTLADLHNNYHKIVGQKKKNDLIGEKGEPKDDEEGLEGEFGSVQELAEKEKVNNEKD